MWFKMVKRYYEAGYYTKEQVKVFVVAEYITVTEYKEITGIEYVS